MQRDAKFLRDHNKFLSATKETTLPKKKTPIMFHLSSQQQFKKYNFILQNRENHCFDGKYSRRRDISAEKRPNKDNFSVFFL